MVVNLHHILAGEAICGLGVRYLDADIDFSVFLGHAGDFLRKAGVAQTVTKGVNHCGIIVNGTVCGSRLIVTVADVDALLVLDHIGLIVAVGTANVTVGADRRVGECWILRQISRPCINCMAAGGDGAVQNLGQSLRAAGAGIGHPKNGIYIGVILQVAHLHNIRAVDDDDNLVKVFFNVVQQIAFFLTQFQLVLAVGIVFCLSHVTIHRSLSAADRAFQIRGKVHALAALTAQHHNSCIMVVGITACDRGSVVALGKFTDIVGHGIELIHRVGCHFHFIQIVGVEFGQGIVQRIACVCQCLGDRGTLTGIAGAGACAAPDRIHAATTENGDFLVGTAGSLCAQGQCVIVVLEQRDALACNGFCSRLGCLVDFLGT